MKPSELNNGYDEKNEIEYITLEAEVLENFSKETKSFTAWAESCGQRMRLKMLVDWDDHDDFTVYAVDGWFYRSDLEGEAIHIPMMDGGFLSASIDDVDEILQIRLREIWDAGREEREREEEESAEDDRQESRYYDEVIHGPRSGWRQS